MNWFYLRCALYFLIGMAVGLFLPDRLQLLVGFLLVLVVVFIEAKMIGIG